MHTLWDAQCGGHAKAGYFITWETNFFCLLVLNIVFSCLSLSTIDQHQNPTSRTLEPFAWEKPLSVISLGATPVNGDQIIASYSLVVSADRVLICARISLCVFVLISSYSFDPPAHILCSPDPLSARHRLSRSVSSLSCCKHEREHLYSISKSVQQYTYAACRNLLKYMLL